MSGYLFIYLFKGKSSKGQAISFEHIVKGKVYEQKYGKHQEL